MATQNSNNHSFLYFIAGALLVAVFAFGFVMYQDEQNEALSQIEASAGGESFELEVTEDGASAEQTQE